MSRQEEIAAFLAEAKWTTPYVENLDADFSTRRFTRLHKEDGSTAVLMDAEDDPKTEVFVVIAWLLRGLNLSAPEIYFEKRHKGLVLMEDFGDGNVGRLIDSGMHSKEDFFMRAASVLSHMHQNFVPTTVRDLRLPSFNANYFTKQVEKFLDGYFPHALKREPTEDERKSFRTVWLDVLKPLDKMPQTLILRDFMPDNVMDLPDRKAWHSFGLLDFQDAGTGPIAYDLASFCEVVRRDGGDIYLKRMLSDYFQKLKPKCTLEELQRSGTILAAQRHTRILGILGGLAQKDPTSSKLSYLPRVEDYIRYLYNTDTMKPVMAWMKSAGFSSLIVP